MAFEVSSCQSAPKTYRGRTYTRRPIAERFAEKVNFLAPAPEYAPHLGSCWIWTATKNHHGYGQMGIADGRLDGAHRVSYELHHGSIPAGMVIDHLCRVPSCVNPHHLEAVTQTVNVLRGTSPMAYNAKKTHCKRGHEFTPENTVLDKKSRRRCKTCSSDNKKRYYQADSKGVYLKNRGWVEKNREAVREYQKAWYLKNADRIKKKMKEDRLKNNAHGL